MATRDTAQLILEVDARIATAQRDVNRLARSIQQDAAGIGGSLKKIEQSSERVGKSLGSISGRTRSGFTQLSFQIGDVSQQLSLGVSASRIFAQQSGQVIQALQIMGGEGNKFLQFLGGPWGLALSTAAVVLGPLAAKLFESKDAVGDLVAKMREQAAQAALNKQADEAWKHTIEGLTEAIRKRREEQEKARQSDVTEMISSLREAEGTLNETAAKVNARAAELDKAVAKVRQLRKELEDPSIVGTPQEAQVQGALAAAEAKVRTITAEIQKGLVGLRTGQQALRGEQAKVLQRQAEQAVDDTKRTADSIAFEIDQLTQKFVNGQIGPAAYRKEIEKLTKALKDAKEATHSTSSGLSGRQIDFAQATEIAKAAGLQVNSAYRSPAKQAALFNDPSVNRPGNPVAPPGASAHNGANGKWAIDIQITDGLTPQKIRKIYADQGVSLSKVLKEKGHFHIEGSRSEAAKAENDQQRQADLQVRRDNAFAEAKDRLNQELLQAQGDLLQGINEQADFAEDAVRAEQKRRDAAIQNDVEEGKLTQAQAEQLKAINESIAAEKSRAIEIGRQVDLIKQQDEDRQRTFQYRIDDLRFADEMAKTQAEKRHVELQIIDILYQQKEAHLLALKAEYEAANNAAKAADIQAEINRLPADKAHDQARTLQNTQSPIDAYFADVPRDADQLNEAMQRLEVQGIDGVINALVEGRKGWGAFRDAAIQAIDQIIAQLIRMQLMKLALNIIGSAAGAPPGVGGDIFSAFAESSGNGGFNLPGFASGGSFTIGGRPGVDQNILSINGRPVARVGQGETGVIIPKMSVPALSAANSNASMSGDNYHINVTAPNTGDPRRDRQTSLQQAADIQRAIAMSRMKGVAA